MVVAYLGWTQELEDVIGRISRGRRIKHLLLYRDPRDSMVSLLRWFTQAENYPRNSETKAHQWFMVDNFSDDDERLSYLIEQHNPDFFGVLDYAQWSNSPNCLALKFEDLYADIASLKRNVLGGVLRELLEYVEYDADTIDPLDFYDKVYGKSLTASTEEQKVGQYKRVFKNQHYALFDNPETRNLLITLGYEW